MPALALLLAAFTATGCSPAPQAVVYPAPLVGDSKTHLVRGEYSPAALDRIARVSIDSGKIVLNGTSASLTLDPPAGADTSLPTRNWALTTDASTDEKRSLTFTHNQSVEDFTIEVPPGGADVLYGVFTGPGGTEVMVLAWDSGTDRFWGYVTIARRP